MSKQSIFGRISQLAKANINALIDSAEDPAVMLDQMVRDYTSSISEAESAIAETIGNLRLMEQDHAEDITTAQGWGSKAIAASRKGDELRAAGNTADADKFDNLAKVALGRQLSAEKEARAVEPTIASQTVVVDQLKKGLDAMRGKLSQLSAARSAASRARSAAKRRGSRGSRSWRHPVSMRSSSSWMPRMSRSSSTRGWQRSRPGLPPRRPSPPASNQHAPVGAGPSGLAHRECQRPPPTLSQP
jgi:phage shock protein A